MQTKGLVISGGLENVSELTEAIGELPDGTIEGLSEYNPSSAYFEKGRIIIKRPQSGDPLTVHFPKDSTNNIAGNCEALFEYKGRRYEIQQ